MKARNMQSDKGNTIANQFIIMDDDFVYFQSYNSIIVKQNVRTGETVLDETYWNWSKTTSKYRNIFLGENTDETKNKIKEGTYTLADLN